MEQYKPAINRGAIMGIVSIIVFVLIYAIDPLFFAKPAGWMVSLGVNLLAIPIVFMILGARDCKPNFSPYKFGNAFNAAFFTAIVATLIVLVFNIIFTNVIDTNRESQIREAAFEQSMEFMEKMGADDDAIDVAMEKAKKKMEEQPNGITAQILNTGKILVWYIILALIIGAVYKEKQQDTSFE